MAGEGRIRHRRSLAADVRCLQQRLEVARRPLDQRLPCHPGMQTNRWDADLLNLKPGGNKHTKAHVAECEAGAAWAAAE